MYFPSQPYSAYIYKDNEVNIRQCIGEAVPTEIMRQIAARIKTEFAKRRIQSRDINLMIAKYHLEERNSLECFVQDNPEDLGLPELQRIVELCNAKREENAAYYTNKFIVNEIMDVLPDFGKDEVRILDIKTPTLIQFNYSTAAYLQAG